MGAVSYLPEIKRLEAKVSKDEKFAVSHHIESKIPLLKVLNEKIEKQENDLRKINQTYRDMFTYSSIGICEVGLDGKFLSVNDAWCKMCKRSKDELINLTWMEITVKNYIKQDENAVLRLVSKQDKTYTMYKEYFDKENNPIPMILTVSCVFDGEGKVEKFISQGIDINGIKDLADTLKAKSDE